MLKDFFYLQKNDRQALIVLLTIFTILTTLVYLMGQSFGSSSQEAIVNDSISSPRKEAIAHERPLYYKMEGTTYELFSFDPNTADSTDFLRLGLKPWQIRSIYRYRAKGGIYRRDTDFARLYGLTKKQFETLRPFIHISDDYRPASDFYGNEPYERNKKRQTSFSSNLATQDETAHLEEKTYSYPQKLKVGQHVNINSADTTELQKIPGIGSYYAKAITRYRDQLGGFVSTRQLQEIEGFPENALAYIHIDKETVKKLSINKLTLNQLRRHPYLNFYQAREICDYRRMNGPLKSLQELRLLKDFPPAEIERLSPYIEF